VQWGVGGRGPALAGRLFKKPPWAPVMVGMGIKYARMGFRLAKAAGYVVGLALVVLGGVFTVLPYGYLAGVPMVVAGLLVVFTVHRFLRPVDEILRSRGRRR